LDDLSPRQRELLGHLVAQASAGEPIPTVRELAAVMGVKAPGTIQDLLSALERKGYLEREAGVARNLRLTEKAAPPDPVRLPLLGRIRAGRPVEAIDTPESLHLVDDLRLAGTYLLQVKGDSMIEDLIAEGDYVVVHPQDTARDGDTVVALLPDGEATLKRFYRERDHIRLQPANSTMEPIRVPEVRIQGRVVAVIRPIR
jgi:repressor LexA